MEPRIEGEKDKEKAQKMCRKVMLRPLLTPGWSDRTLASAEILVPT